LRPGNTNSQVTKAIDKVAQDFGVKACAGVLSHRMKRFVIDGNKVILLREDTDQKVEDSCFELNEVYSIDIAMSTGEGKPKEMEARTTVFKRSVDKNYMLKMRSSRTLFNEINTKFPALPFTLRALDDERQARMGIVECLKHELVYPYPVLYEKKGDHVVHFKFTVLILPSGPTRISGLKLFDVGTVKSEKLLSDDINAIMSIASKKKKKKPKRRTEDKGNP
jgi:curved DNA binding protein